MAEKRFYWLKLQKDFFKRGDIQIVESLPNGKDYVLFYLKMLLESIDHEGELRFSETIPYNAEMLATITNTNVDIVRAAMKVFSEFGMVEILEDKTIYMNEIQKLIGSAVDNDNANRQRRFREKKALVTRALPDRYASVTKNNESKSIEIEKDIEIEKKKRFSPPTREELQQYITENNYNVDADAFIDFYTSCGWVIGKNKPMKDWKSTVRNWHRREHKPAKAKTAPSDSMTHNYTAEQMAELRRRAKE